VVEHVEYRGSTTSYTVRTAAGLIRADARTGPARVRGGAVLLGLPRTAHIVDAS